MPDRPSVSVIFPAYNEREAIGRTLAEAKSYFDRRGTTCELIVCADGKDGTAELVQSLALKDSTIRVVANSGRRGKGYAIRSGVALANGAFVGFVDADNKTPISEFDKFEPKLLEGYDVVIGSRALRDSRVEQRQPLHRRLGSRAFGVVMHLLVGLPDIADTQCGFKFFPRSVAVDLFSRQQVDGYMFDVEILSLAHRSRYKIVEVPVRWRDDADSRYQVVSGTLANAIDLLRISVGRARQALPRNAGRRASKVNRDVH